MSSFVSIFVMDSIAGSLLNAALAIGFVISAGFAVVVGLKGEHTPEQPPHRSIKR